MTVAIIDLGTNTFHLLLVVVSKGSYRIIKKIQKGVKVGKNGINQDEITATAWKRTLKTLKEFKTILKQHEVTKTYAIATSTFRNAKNGEQLAKEISQKTGIDINIISGNEEAELILKGVRTAVDLGKEKNLIIDIGGGSVECIIANQKKTFWLKSFEIGGQRLVELFHKHDPITHEEISLLIQYLNHELKDLYQVCQKHSPKILVGCSGTFDTLYNIYFESKKPPYHTNKTSFDIPIDVFKDIYKNLINKSKSERMSIKGMVALRVETVVVVCVLIHILIEKINIKTLRVSTYALKEGILMDVLHKM